MSVETETPTKIGTRIAKHFLDDLARQELKETKQMEACGCASCRARALNIYRWYADEECKKTGVVYKKKRG